MSQNLILMSQREGKAMSSLEKGEHSIKTNLRGHLFQEAFPHLPDHITQPDPFD